MERYSDRSKAPCTELSFKRIEIAMWEVSYKTLRSSENGSRREWLSNNNTLSESLNQTDETICVPKL
jgi:hypothetical protein